MKILLVLIGLAIIGSCDGTENTEKIVDEKTDYTYEDYVDQKEDKQEEQIVEIKEEVESKKE